MSAHTRGSWEAVEAGFTGSGRPIYDVLTADGYRRICENANPSDARLIAAAPELLEELQESIGREFNPFEPDNQSARYKRLRALFAKATGE